MSQAVKEILLLKLEEEPDNDPDALSKEISSRLQMDDDFIWVENTQCEELSMESDNEVNAIVNVVQYDTNARSSANIQEGPLECSAEPVYGVITPSEWERGLSVEQQYWEQGPVAKNVKSFQPKYPASQRLTIKEYGKIDHSKRRNRDPSHFKFDFSTIAVLKKLQELKHAGPYHNIVGKGSNSVVIYAEYPKVPYTRQKRRCHYAGVAVKVYKLSSDVDKNNAIFKRVQREYAHLQLTCGVIHKMKNVIVTQFIGQDQETAPSISFLPSGYCRDMYKVIIQEMERWYDKLNLVHGKLCMKNIVLRSYRNGSRGLVYIPHFLGWSHSVKTDHPQALVKLLRDCQFVTNFFKSREVPVKSAEELFKAITGLKEISSKVLDALQKKNLWQKKCLTNPNRE